MGTGLALQVPGLAGSLGYSACADGDCTNEAENATSVVQKFSSADMEPLADFSQRVSQVQGQRGMRSFGQQWKMLGELASQRPSTANNLFTLQQNEVVEGAMRVRETGGQFWITHLEGLGGGTGTELVKAAIRESIARGYEGSIHLVAASQAVSFYEKLGFVLTQSGSGGPEYLLTIEAAQKLLGQ